MRSRVTGRHTRRNLLKGVVGTGLAATVAGLSRRPGSAAGARWAQEMDWQRFDDDVQAAMETFRMVGVAVAVVDRGGVVHQATFGPRDIASGAPVTPETHFQVASTTKSMTSLMVATCVDDGLLAWDQPVREIWPDFLAPTEEMTSTLRVRDLLGMDTGLGEEDARIAFHQGYPTAADLLRSVSLLPVIAEPNTTFFYNGTVYATGGYLPALAEGAAMAELETVYARQMTERVYGPVGMAAARITDDPRPFVTNYATGYGVDLTRGTSVVPYAAVGSYAPAGGTLATLTDMANYVTMQLDEGVSITGDRVVSAANLAECWAPRIDIPLAPLAPILGPEVVSVGYGMGWNSQTYQDGRRFIFHAGGIDGFTSFIGFFPDDQLGLVVLTNMMPEPRGINFGPLYVPYLLANQRFGLGAGMDEVIVAQYQAGEQRLTDLAAQVEPIDPEAIAPYLGFYEKGWRLAFDTDGELRLHQISRALRLLAMPDGSYVIADGLTAGIPVHFSRDETGMPWLEIVNIETARWLSSGPDVPVNPVHPAATPVVAGAP